MSIANPEPLVPRWEAKKTDETRIVESLLRTEFAEAEAYRQNSASIRVRVIDRRFEGKSPEKRHKMVSDVLGRLPEATRSQIIMLLILAPEEAETSFLKSMANLEFEDPSPALL